MHGRCKIDKAESNTRERDGRFARSRAIVWRPRLHCGRIEAKADRRCARQLIDDYRRKEPTAGCLRRQQTSQIRQRDPGDRGAHRRLKLDGCRRIEWRKVGAENGESGVGDGREVPSVQGSDHGRIVREY